MKQEAAVCPKSYLTLARNYIDQKNLPGFFEWIRSSNLTNDQVTEIIGFFRQQLPADQTKLQLQPLLQDYLDFLFQSADQELLLLVMSWYVSVSMSSDWMAA